MSESLARQLYRAVKDGKVDKVRSLLQQGAYPNHQLYWSEEWDGKWPPLHQACVDGNLEIVKVLHAGGADPHKGDRQYNATPLHEACARGNKEVVEYLIRVGGCDVDVRDNDGWTPLHYACSKGHTETVRFLVEEGKCAVDVRDKYGDTPLHDACSNGHTEIVRFLVEEGKCAVDVTDNKGRIPLDWAVMWNKTKVVDYLKSLPQSPPQSGTTDPQSSQFTNTEPPQSATPLTKEDTDALKVLLPANGVNPDKVFFESTLEKVQELLTERGLTELATNLRAKLDEETSQSVSGSSANKLPIATNQQLRQATHSPSQDTNKPQIFPVFPKNWIVDSNSEISKTVHQVSDSTEGVSIIYPKYPLYQTSTHPKITFVDKPEKRGFSSAGGHTDFKNGIEVTVPPNIIAPESTLEVKVQPSFAPKDVFLMPEGVQSASPSYLISCENSSDLNEEVTVTMEHHVDDSTEEDAQNLVFLQAGPISGEKGVYKYQEVSDGKSEVIPGERKGKLTIAIKKLSSIFLKIGSKVKKSLKKLTSTTTGNLYTVRVYRSSPGTTGDMLAIIFVSLFGSVYSKFLEILDKELIPRDYPQVSTSAADKTTQGGVKFVEACATLHAHQNMQGWTVEPDKKIISKIEADQPETECFDPADLHDYPPRMICRFFPERNALKRSTCTMSVAGLRPEVIVNIPLRVPKPNLKVDTTKLQNVKSDVLSISDTELSSTVSSILFLMDTMTGTLRSSSLSDLSVQTDSIKTEVEAVLTKSKRVAKECTRDIIGESVEANCSTLGLLSHQLCQVTKIRLKHCQDESDETAALVDLVECGTNLLTTMGQLLKDMKTLSEIGKKIGSVLKQLEDHGIVLDSEITEEDITYLARHFDDVEQYLRLFGLTRAEQADVKRMATTQGNHIAMGECLSRWRQHDPSTATLRLLLTILQELNKGEIVADVSDYFCRKCQKGFK